MTKALTALAGLICLLLAAPAASAHGAAAAREIDTRLLADDEGAIPYGGCLEGQCLPGLEAEGLDLVVLEVREAYLEGQPAVVFRIIYQTDDAHEGRVIDLSFTAGGKEQSFSFATDGAKAPTGTFDKVLGPFDAFDGFPKAVDAYLKYSTLGVKAGDSLTGIKATSTFEGEDSDILPGTWFAGGEEMPYIPNVIEEGELEQPEPASYALVGPATLLDIVRTNTTDGFTLKVTNKLAGMAQFVTLVATGVTLDAPTANLEGGASREFKVTGTTGLVNVTSDLDAFQAFAVGNVSPPTTSTSTSVTSTHHGGSTGSASTTNTGSSSQTGTHDEGHDEDDTKDAPGLMLPALVGVLGLAIALMRRRL